MGKFYTKLYNNLGELHPDTRPKKSWWATGYYVNKCYTCGEDYLGDKRSRECSDCAYKD